jgi:hypothetical protein
MRPANNPRLGVLKTPRKLKMEDRRRTIFLGFPNQDSGRIVHRQACTFTNSHVHSPIALFILQLSKAFALIWLIWCAYLVAGLCNP